MLFGAPTLHNIQLLMLEGIHATVTCHAMWERPRIEMSVTCACSVYVCVCLCMCRVCDCTLWLNYV